VLKASMISTAVYRWKF